MEFLLLLLLQKRDMSWLRLLGLYNAGSLVRVSAACVGTHDGRQLLPGGVGPSFSGAKFPVAFHWPMLPEQLRRRDAGMQASNKVCQVCESGVMSLGAKTPLSC